MRQVRSINLIGPIVLVAMLSTACGEEQERFVPTGGWWTAVMSPLENGCELPNDFAADLWQFSGVGDAPPTERGQRTTIVYAGTSGRCLLWDQEVLCPESSNGFNPYDEDPNAVVVHLQRLEGSFRGPDVFTGTLNIRATCGGDTPNCHSVHPSVPATIDFPCVSEFQVDVSSPSTP